LICCDTGQGCAVRQVVGSARERERERERELRELTAQCFFLGVA